MDDSILLLDVWEEEKSVRSKVSKLLRCLRDVNEKDWSNQKLIQKLKDHLKEASDDDSLAQVLNSHSSYESVEKYKEKREEISNFFSIYDGLSFWRKLVQARDTGNEFKENIERYILEFEQCRIAVKEVTFHNEDTYQDDQVN